MKSESTPRRSVALERKTTERPQKRKKDPAPLPEAGLPACDVLAAAEPDVGASPVQVSDASGTERRIKSSLTN